MTPIKLETPAQWTLSQDRVYRRSEIRQ